LEFPHLEFDSFMQIDNTTLQDLSIFHADEDQSVLNKLNFCQTFGGRQWLKYMLSHPFDNEKQIVDTQRTLQIIIQHIDHWPQHITNGTIMVLQRFYESQIDTIPSRPGPSDAIFYRLFHRPDYGLVKYTVGHAIDFMKGMHQLNQLLQVADTPAPLLGVISETESLLKSDIMQQMLRQDKQRMSPATMLRYGHYLLNHCRDKMPRLIENFSKLDAWYALAKATKVYDLQFPEFTTDQRPYIAAEGLYHILLQTPVSYRLEMSHDNNFIFLTGANMAGKSTFIKSVGLAVYLAHIGMAVPARSMELTLFHGLLSNIQVADNIVKGESYFFNEVQRIKNTILKINNGQKWLVLIDELFKGTNVQDAMRCSETVIKGLLKISNSLFILSTHLYEIAEELKPYPNIAFRYFETHVTEDKLTFSYQLKEGVSNDRLGYLILKQEGVVDMIERL
jgi:DNA mismatch repair protein MutS